MLLIGLITTIQLLIILAFVVIWIFGDVSAVYVPFLFASLVFCPLNFWLCERYRRERHRKRRR